MRPGDIIADRFEIERAVAAGGMGHVYRASDRLSGGAVALKILTSTAPGGPLRFSREAQALAGLRHPGIVRYVAHGVTSHGKPYLAMEWLSGETLSARLGVRPLSVAESLTLAERVAAALGVVHRRGLVHRDLKPANLLLEAGAIEGVKLIDFGIARPPAGSVRLTLPGATLGTPGYMAPEQIRGAAEVDARADVFSFGCVLFRCVAGQAAFDGEDHLSILLKVLIDDAPRLREIVPSIPPALDRLVARMMAKSPEDRPDHGDAVGEELAALREIQVGPRSAPVSSAKTTSSLELTATERRVMCLVLTRDSPGDDGITLSPSEDAAREHALRAAAERYGGGIEMLADRSVLVVLGSAGEATDLAARAARCAIALKTLIEAVPAAVVTGRTEVSARLPVGELIDRAVGLSAKGRGVPREASIRIDEVTAGLVGGRFDVGTDEAGLWLGAEREALASARTLLGKPTPCVGRERELALIEDTLHHGAAQGAAVVVLVTARAGTGKSRLAHELLGRLRERDLVREIWIGRGDPVSAGSAFSLLGQALRRGVGQDGGEPLDARQKKLLARVREHALPDTARVAAFLGELIGTPFPDDSSVELRAARRDPRLMGDQMLRAFVDFLRAECEAAPVLLVLEDLHWGDLPTVKFIDAALRELADHPLLVLALARPEVHELFPKLWDGRSVHQVHLPRLSRRASERLMREVLGAVSEARARALLDRAEGNAFYLEELIRAEAEGKGAALPETVLAMVQTRLLGLDPEARRVLRAASIFGKAFWRGGVSRLLDRTDVEGWLTALVQQEMISLAPEGKFPGEVEYWFRHALVREAAYGMLTNEDRSMGHRLAAEWLEGAGDGDAMVLAEHFERGGEPGRAAIWYRRAAEQAFEGNDLEAAIARAERAITCDASGQMHGELLLLLAKAYYWRGENAAAVQRGIEAMHMLRRGSASFCEAAAEVARASGRVRDMERLIESSEALLALPIHAEAPASLAIALACAARIHQVCRAAPERAEALLRRAEEVASLAGDDPAVTAEVLLARSRTALLAGDISGYLALIKASRASYEAAGDLREVCVQSLNVGYAQMQLGAYEEAVRALNQALVEAERLGLSTARTTGKHNLGLALALQGKLEEACAAEEEAISLASAQNNRRMEAAARTYLARILTLARDPARAAEVARGVADEPAVEPTFRAYALAALAEAQLAKGSVTEALSAAEEAAAILGSLGEIEEAEPLIRLACAEARFATGDRGGAQKAILEARCRLLARAEKIADPALRKSFLERVPENARTLERAGAWLDGA